MISKLQSPMVAAMAGLLLSTLLGIYLCWQAAGTIMANVVVPVAKAPEVETARGWDFWTIEIENLSNELRDERARQRQQAEELEQRAARLAAEEVELGKVRAELEALRAEIGNKIVEVTADEAKNLRTLAQTYSNLTPRAAVAIIRALDDTMTVKILSLMKPDVVGPIFEEMSRTADDEGVPLAERAAKLSNRLRLIKATKAENAG
jgi:flagellar motility protein MotE (MotC chaperone)